MYDFILVGGGPAGTQAALTLALQNFRIAVIDSNRPRNAAALEIRGFLSLLPTPAHKFRQICRDTLLQHKNVDFLFARVIDIEQEPHKGRYSVRFVRGAIEENIFGKYILIATGLQEELPQISNFRAFYGSAIQSCLWCYAFEVSDKRVGLLATEYDNNSIAELAKYSNLLHRLCREVKVFVPREMIDTFMGQIGQMRDADVISNMPVSALQSADGRTFAGFETDSERHMLDFAFVLPKYSAGERLLTLWACT